MNPLLTAKTNPLFLPFNQLKPHCSRLYNSLHDSNITNREKIKLEQLLWAEIKLVRNFKDPGLLNYLIGYYHAILFQLVRQPSVADLLHYHILIRLGDLNRYLQRESVAVYYYSNARNLFPLFGHAYNQLALILAEPPVIQNDYYKCCYYYARAAKSSEKSLVTMAESNLRIASRVKDNSILNQLLNYDDPTNEVNTKVDNDCCLPEDESSNVELIKQYPSTSTNWFYLMVVAIYADNIQPIAKQFLEFMKENFATQRATLVVACDNIKSMSIYCDKDSYLLLATLDILLDWLKFGTQGGKLLESICNDLRKIRHCLQSTLASIKFEYKLMKNSLRDTDQVAFKESCSYKTSPKPVGFDRDISKTSEPHSLYQDQTSLNLDASESSKSSASSATLKNLKIALPHDYVLRGFKPLDVIHKEILFCEGNELVTMINERVFNESDSLTEHSKFAESALLKVILARITTKMDGFGNCIKKRSRNIALESILSNINDD